jgi:hypothetical protein
MGVKYLNPNGEYMSKGSYDKKPIVNLYRCHNLIDKNIEIYRFGTKISLEDRDTDFISKGPKGVELIRDISKSSKNVLCISLISPCNEKICHGTRKSIVESASSDARKGFTEDTILGYELLVINPKVTFISFPLSNNNFKGMIPLYNYENLKNDISETSNDPLAKYIYTRIDLQTPKSTFESIVNIAYYYYYKLIKSHTLMLHCKSGRDRSGIFDAVLQASIYHIQNTNFVQRQIECRSIIIDKFKPCHYDYNLIRIYSQRFLFHGLSIAYYATSIRSLKLGSIQVAKYILGSGDLYKFYSGHSKDA